MEDEDEPRQSGLLSPRRIEAIHIAFNKVFENVIQEGTIRDPSSYRSFEEEYMLAMARRNGVDITEYTQDQTKKESNERKSPEILEDGGWERDDEKGPVVINSQESRNEDILFSDEEKPPRKISSVTPSKRKKNNAPKRKVELVDSDSQRKKKPRTRKSEPVSKSDPSRRNTLSAVHLLSTDEESSAKTNSRTIKSDDPPLLLPPSGKKNKYDYEYRNIPPDTTVTILLQRDQPAKPPSVRIPFFGRLRGEPKRISLDRLWEVHYRIERIKKAGLPVVKKSSLSVPYTVHKSVQKVNLPGYDPITNGYRKSMDSRGTKRGNGIMRGSSMRGKAISGTTIRGSRGAFSGRGRGSTRARRT